MLIQAIENQRIASTAREDAFWPAPRTYAYLIHVFGEPVEDASHRCLIEKRYLRAHNTLEQLVQVRTIIRLVALTQCRNQAICRHMN